MLGGVGRDQPIRGREEKGKREEREERIKESGSHCHVDTT